MGTHQSIALVTASASGVTADIVPIGAEVKAVYVELWLIASGNQEGSQIAIVEKVQNAQGGAGFINLASLDDYTNKRNIFYQTMGLLGSDNSNPIPVIRQWIKIPKGKQRFAQGDSLKLQISAQGTDIMR